MAIGDKSDTTLATFLGRAPDQVAYVVHDLEAAVHEFGRKMGISRWSGWVYDEYLPRKTYRGQPATWVSRVAIPEYGPSLEIIAAEGDSIFSDFLDARGPGLHHIGYFVPSLAEAAEALEKQGMVQVQSGGGHGVDGDGEFTFFDLTGTFGSYLELIEPPQKRFPPHFTIETRR